MYSNTHSHGSTTLYKGTKDRKRTLLNEDGEAGDYQVVPPLLRFYRAELASPSQYHTQSCFDYYLQSTQLYNNRSKVETRQYIFHTQSHNVKENVVPPPISLNLPQNPLLQQPLCKPDSLDDTCATSAIMIGLRDTVRLGHVVIPINTYRVVAYAHRICLFRNRARRKNITVSLSSRANPLPSSMENHHQRHTLPSPRSEFLSFGILISFGAVIIPTLHLRAHLPNEFAKRSSLENTSNNRFKKAEDLDSRVNIERA